VASIFAHRGGSRLQGFAGALLAARGFDAGVLRGGHSDGQGVAAAEGVDLK